MRREFHPFENQVGVAVEGVNLAKTCFACYSGSVRASIQVGKGGGFSISVFVPNVLNRSLTFTSVDDFYKRSELYYDAEGVAYGLLQSCLKAENICGQSNLPVPEVYSLEVRSSRVQGLFTYDLV